MNLAPGPNTLGNQTTADALYERLRRDVLAGVLPPGERLDQSEICATFNVSRTPLKEALRRLEAEGLVVIRSNRGVTVAVLDVRDITEIYAIRTELESYAAKEAVRLEPEATARRMADALQRMERLASDGLPETQDLLQVHGDFHGALYEGCGNRHLISLIEDLRRRCAWYRQAHQTEPGQWKISLDQHRAIWEAVASGDPERASALIRDNLVGTAEALLGRLSRADLRSKGA